MLFLSYARAFAQDRQDGLGLDEVIAKAKALADAPYAAPVSNLPDVFGKLQFADYQKIQPLRDRFAWAQIDTPFKLAFYHQGMQFNTSVKINEIVDGAVHEIPYDPSCFDFGDLHFDREQTSKLGWPGFRVLYPINQPGKYDEVMSVLGASYFRVIGKGQVYGLSGQGARHRHRAADRRGVSRLPRVLDPPPASSRKAPDVLRPSQFPACDRRL